MASALSRKNTLHISAAIGIFLNSTGQILTIQNSRGVDVPGGHMEPGETVYEALERELMEEAGATAANLQIVYAVLGPYKQHPLSAMIFVTGTISSFDQHKSQWMTVSEFLRKYSQDQSMMKSVFLAAGIAIDLV